MFWIPARTFPVRAGMSVCPSSLHGNAESTGQILHELPRCAAGARSARGRPFERLAMQCFTVRGHFVVRNIAIDHRQIFVLAATMEAEPKAEAVGERDLLLDCFPRIDRG